MALMSIMRIRHEALIGALFLAALASPALPNASHAAPAQVALRTITITPSHISFPKSMRAGMLRVDVVNDARDSFSASIGRANPGVPIAEIEAASAKSDTPEGFNRLIHLVTFLGGVDSLQPGGKATVVFDLRTPGLYGLHTALGNNAGHDTLFSVAPASRQDAARPAADVTVTLKDMAFLGLPRHLAAGAVTFKLTNRGPSVHHMIFLRLDPGKTVVDVLHALRNRQQPNWAHDAGGMDLLSPHQTTWLSLDLIPGNYAALSFLPDPVKGGEPQAYEGMDASFTVS